MNHNHLKPATDLQVKAGYDMMKARMHFAGYDNDYLDDAIKSVLAATSELMSKDGMYRNEASKVLKLLYKAQHVQIQWREATGRNVPLSVMNQHAEEIGDGHYEASVITGRHGYAPPTKEQLGQHGGGGSGR